MYNNWSVLCKLARPAVKNAEVNFLKVFCCNRTTRKSTLAKLQWMLYVEQNGYELIPHRVYSPDLAPSDFFLFPNLKKDIRGCHFRSDEEVVTAVEEWVSGKDPDSFSSGLKAREHRWSKCIILEGNYTEKERWISTGNKLGWLLIDSPSYYLDKLKG